MQNEESCNSAESSSKGPIFGPMTRLDYALHELEMLAKETEASAQYMSEIRKKNPLLLGIINTRYVSNVSIGCRLKSVSANSRVCPYNKNIPRTHTISHSEMQRPTVNNITVGERCRTKSENAEVVKDITPFIETIVDMAVDITKAKAKASMKTVMKKSKSLENVHIENDNASQPSHEMEFVSSRIQKLKMNE